MYFEILNEYKINPKESMYCILVFKHLSDENIVHVPIDVIKYISKHCVMPYKYCSKCGMEILEEDKEIKASLHGKCLYLQTLSHLAVKISEEYNSMVIKFLLEN